MTPFLTKLVVPKWLQEFLMDMVYIALIITAFVLWGEYKEHIGSKKTADEMHKQSVKLQQFYLRQALATEEKHRKHFDEEVARLQEEMEKGYAKREKVIAGLRSGELRLRKQWQGCPANLPEAPASAGSADEEARLRAEGAGDIVRVVSDCSAHVESLQNILRAERQE